MCLTMVREWVQEVVCAPAYGASLNGCCHCFLGHSPPLGKDEDASVNSFMLVVIMEGLCDFRAGF